jgi:hypothetical protein
MKAERAITYIIFRDDRTRLKSTFTIQKYLTIIRAKSGEFFLFKNSAINTLAICKVIVGTVPDFG